MKTSWRRRVTAVAGLLMVGSASALTLSTAHAADVPTGEVAVTSELNNFRLFQAGPELNNNGSAVLAFGKLQIGAPTPTNQRFTITKHSDTAFGPAYIVCSKSVSLGGGLSCLDIVGDSKSAGARTAIKPYDGSTSQRWIIQNKDSVRPATRTFMNLNSKLYIDSGPAPVDISERPTQQPFKLSPQQRFFIKAAVN